MSITIGIDIGGTFTDVVALDNESGRAAIHQGQLNSSSAWLMVSCRAPTQVREPWPRHHSQTFPASPTAPPSAPTPYWRPGAPQLASLPPGGFEDVLTIGRQKRSDMYDVFIEPETPVFLAPRRQHRSVLKSACIRTAVVDVPLDEGEVDPRCTSPWLKSMAWRP